MAISNILYKNEYRINDFISIRIPTVGDVLDNEEEYYFLVTVLTAMPIDMMVQLADANIDFTTINEYELFLLMFQSVCALDTKLVFGDLDLTKFKIATNPQNGTPWLIDEQNDIKIDRAIYGQISDFLRKLHGLTKNNHKPANKEAQDFMIERARKKMRRKNKQAGSSQLEPLIIALVNTEQYKYDFERTRELSIYQFNESVRQVIKKVDYDNKMFGVYTGNLNAKELSQDDLNWLVHK